MSIAPKSPPQQRDVPSPFTTPASVAGSELAARVEEVLRSFQAHVATPVDAATLDALRVDILELAKGHAARTLLEAATAKQRAPRRSRRRAWGGRL